jgi:hypothetical protein
MPSSGRYIFLIYITNGRKYHNIVIFYTIRFFKLTTHQLALMNWISHAENYWKVLVM